MIDFTKDLKLLKIKKRTKCNQNREEWRRTVETAKTFKDRSCRAKEGEGTDSQILVVDFRWK
jgi:hypothetical protein